MLSVLAPTPTLSPTSEQNVIEISPKPSNEEYEDAINENENMRNDESSEKYKIITWNLWGMIFHSRTLSNPLRCAKYIQNIAKKEDWTSYNGLIICSFQELWSWKTGLFPPLILQMIALFEYIPLFGFIISFIFQFCTLLFGILPVFKCMPIQYNPKVIVADKLKKYVPFAYYNQDIPLRNVLDSGLLILSNQEADKFGSFGFNHCSCDDSLAHKGFVYVYFKKYHTLVINTHLQHAGDGTERLLQIKEIVSFINGFSKLIGEEIESLMNIDEEYERISGQKLKIIATGDWNVDMSNYQNDKATEDSQQTVLTVVSGSVETEKERECSLSDVDINDQNVKISMELQHRTSNKKVLSRGVKLPVDEVKSCIDLPAMLGPTFQKVNGCEATCKDQNGGCIDHIFVNFDIDGLKEEIGGNEKSLSDHLMVKTDFECNNCFCGI